MIVTKELLKSIKTASAMILRLDGKYSLLEFNFDVFDKDKGCHVRSHSTTYEIDMSKDKYDFGFNSKRYGEYKGCWILNLYNNTVTHEGSSFGTMKDKDEMYFNICNAGNAYTRATGINVLTLELEVVRHTKSIDKRFKFILDTQTCPTNSACNLQSGVELLPYPDLPELSQYA